MSRVVIVGAGFAGLNAAKVLGGTAGIDVVLLDRENHHLFTPLLYQVAMAGLSPADIAAPIRSLLSDYGNIRVLLADVREVDLPRRVIVADIGDVPFDYLVLCTGAAQSYFGHGEIGPRDPAGGGIAHPSNLHAGPGFAGGAGS